MPAQSDGPTNPGSKVKENKDGCAGRKGKKLRPNVAESAGEGKGGKGTSAMAALSARPGRQSIREKRKLGSLECRRGRAGEAQKRGRLGRASLANRYKSRERTLLSLSLSIQALLSYTHAFSTTSSLTRERRSDFFCSQIRQRKK